MKKTPPLVRAPFKTLQKSHPPTKCSCCGFFLVINLLMSFDDQGLSSWSKIKVRVLVVGASSVQLKTVFALNLQLLTI